MISKHHSHSNHLFDSNVTTLAKGEVAILLDLINIAIPRATPRIVLSSMHFSPPDDPPAAKHPSSKHETRSLKTSNQVKMAAIRQSIIRITIETDTARHMFSTCFFCYFGIAASVFISPTDTITFNTDTIIMIADLNTTASSIYTFIPRNAELNVDSGGGNHAKRRS